MAGRLHGKIALVTGASRGIGAAVAERYAQEGAELILLSRTVGGLEETDDRVKRAGGKASLVPHDLKEPEKLDLLGQTLHQRYGKLDIVVGNAAFLGALTPVSHAEPAMWDQAIAINLIANYRLLRALHPLLAASDAGRAIFVTSGAAHVAVAYWGAYAVSKAGLEMLVRTYAAENAKTNIRANLIDPGVVRTRMRSEAFPGEDASRNASPEWITERFVQLAESGFVETGKLYHAGEQQR